MSTTEIYAVRTNGDVKHYGSATNSWLGGFHVWKSLEEKYEIDEKFMEFDKTCKNFGKGLYEKYEDIMLGSTFDGVWVKKENFEKLINAFSEYFEIYPNSNFGQQIELIKKMNDDSNIIGVAWCQTSVCDDMWDFDYDEETDELIPYNILKGNRHWELFEVLEENK